LPYSKFKAYLRKLATRTVPGLHRAIRSCLHILKPRECANYYKHAGYMIRIRCNSCPSRRRDDQIPRQRPEHAFEFAKKLPMCQK
jgi:hypothetical protein